MQDNTNRIASISVVLTDRDMAGRVNDILSTNGDIIHGRLGIPYKDRGVSVVTVIVDADNARLGALGGSLGNVPGVKVRSTVLA